VQSQRFMKHMEEAYGESVWLTFAICDKVHLRGSVDCARAAPAMTPPSIVVEMTCSAMTAPATTSAIFKS